MAAVDGQRTVDEPDPVDDHDPQPQVEVDDLVDVDVEGAGMLQSTPGNQRRATVPRSSFSRACVDHLLEEEATVVDAREPVEMLVRVRVTVDQAISSSVSATTFRVATTARFAGPPQRVDHCRQVVGCQPIVGMQELDVRPWESSIARSWVAAEPRFEAFN